MSAIPAGLADGVQRFDGSFLNLLEEANRSAAALVDLLIRNFEDLDDVHQFEGRRVRFHKRAQILVADLWACFEGQSYGEFQDIGQVTMFAGTLQDDRRVRCRTNRPRLPDTSDSPRIRLHPI